ncbi:glycosyltransferase family 2 protein [Alicyclobacillus tolerans]|uniref:glycosyltransferase family 2 protein n=1 Tax=Alicyclobacillus tolerans TaxID=90970 RepID=UPI001F326586|nr:glycosyltransferase family 2 protein [Alicyclobacillus tolerans]MCF8567858.1 glycosyltransferase family 2 protein [Alicyclobacillus tolerans]
MISVILVTFQSVDVLPQCLDSLERCSSSNELDIWIVDNQSTDGTWEWLIQYKNDQTVKPFLNLHFLRLGANKGYAYANNRALAKAQGDYFLLLNPDTIVSKDAIQACLDVMTANQSIGAATCRLELANGEMDRACRRSFPTLWNSFTYFSGLARVFHASSRFASYQLTYLDEFGSYPVDTVSGAFMLLSRVVYEQIGGFDEDYFMYGEDIDYCYRMKQNGYKVWYDGGVTTTHLKGGNGGKKSKASLFYFYDTMGIFFEKHYMPRYPPWFGIVFKNLYRKIIVNLLSCL